MSESAIDQHVGQPYKYGWSTDIESELAPIGLKIRKPSPACAFARRPYWNALKHIHESGKTSRRKFEMPWKNELSC